MGQIFNVFNALNGHLNLLNKKYNEGGIVRTIEPPLFVTLAISRAVDTASDRSLVVEDQEKNVEVQLASVISDKGDLFNPIYVCVCENLVHSIVDQCPVFVNHNDVSGTGIALIICIPKKLFMSYTSFDDAAKELYIIYSKVLETDLNMQFLLDVSMLNYSENSVNPVPLYDLTMAYTALGCVHINLVSWYRSNKSRIKALSTLNAIFGDELLPDIKTKIASTLDKNAVKIGMLRDAIASGRLVLDAMYDYE